MKSHEILKGSEAHSLLGCPARSLAGHDKGEYFSIIAEEGDFAALADGSLRTVAKPKWKKKKHMQIGKQPLITEFPVEDKIIRRELKNYVKSHCGN